MLTQQMFYPGNHLTCPLKVRKKTKGRRTENINPTESLLYVVQAPTNFSPCLTLSVSSSFLLTLSVF